MPTVACKCCKNKFDDVKTISCHTCHDIYFHQCIDMGSADLRFIKSKKGLTWSCESCSLMGDSISDLKSVIVALQREVAGLKAVQSNSSSSENVDFEDIVNEVSDRQYRKNNLIIFGIPDNSSNAKDVIKEIFSEMRCDLEEDITPVRLGKPDSSRKLPRPIKLRFKSHETVFKLLFKSKLLRSSEKFKNIRMSSDKTPRQQELYRKIKQELNARIANGETNIQIKYVNGIPRIVNSAVNPTLN